MKLNYESPPRALISLRAMKIIAPVQVIGPLMIALLNFGPLWLRGDTFALTSALSLFLSGGLAVIAILGLAADYFCERRERAIIAWICFELIIVGCILWFCAQVGRAAIGAS